MNKQAIARCIGVLSIAFTSHSYALFEPLFEDGEWAAEFGAEWRYFNDPGEFGQEQHALSLSSRAEYYHEWNDGDDWFKFAPFLRVDAADSERTHLDIQEGFWGHLGENWETKLGVTRVFWGRTEFLNLVDVINQKDFVEGTTDAKLGQPLFHLSLVHELGVLDFYTLIGFRERTFAGEDGRLRTPIVVDTDAARYGKGASKNDIGFAARWAQPVGDYFEVALSAFSGVGREPFFAFNFDFRDPRLIPVYYHQEQFGLEAEFLYEGWVGKLEAISVETHQINYTAAVIGAEYTFGSVFDSAIDVTAIVEYLWDDRGELSPGFLEHDVGIGTRITFNDEFDSSMLIGGLIDPDTKEKIFQLEASRRLDESWKIKASAAVVLERGQPEVGQTNIESINNLLNSGVFGGDIDYQFMLEWAIDVLQQNGIEVLVDPQFFLEPLQLLERLADTDRKISILESDDYVQVELIYFF